MQNKEYADLTAKIEILTDKSTTYGRYLFNELIMKYESDNSKYVSFKVFRGFEMPNMTYAFYMIIADDPTPILLHRERVDMFMRFPWEAAIFANDFNLQRRRFESVH